MTNYYKYELNLTTMNLLSILLFIVPFFILLFLGYDFNFSNLQPGLTFLGCLVYLMTHELFHGLGYSLFAKDKKNIKYGIALEKGVLFAACQEKLSKKAILISLMLPLIFLSILTTPFALIFHIDWLLIFSIMNFAGAIGDILMFVLILRGPKDLEYIDYNTDIGAYLLSKTDLSNYKSFGFHLTESGLSSKKEVDKSIKFFSVSKSSFIILAFLVFLSLINIILS